MIWIKKIFEALGDKTEGYSGSDIFNVVRNALMEPIRTCTLSQHFKKVKGKHPKTGEIHEDFLTPCLGTDDGAMEMILNDVSGDKLLPPIVSYKDFEKSIKSSKSSVSKNDLKQYEKYTEEFGEEG